MNTPYSNVDYSKFIVEHPTAKHAVKGLKDHQIAELVNELTKTLKPLIPYQSLRSMIENTTVEYLSKNNLRIDKKH